MTGTCPDTPAFISQEQFELISEQEAKFILDQGEKQLKDINDTSLQIVSRSTTLLTINLGFIVALSGFCIKKWGDNNHQWDTALFIAFWLMLYLITIVATIFINLIPKSYYINGAEPADYFTAENVFVKTNSTYRMIAIYTNEIIQTQIRIKQNKMTNDKRWNVFNLTVLLLSLVPIVIILLYWISGFKTWNLIL